MKLGPLLLGLVALSPISAAEGPRSYDVVYGATAGGTMAAIAAAKEGSKVVLLEPRRHVGGMVSGGLGRTDMDRQEHVIGGMAREFFERVGRHYGQVISWVFEPSVAEKVLRDWLEEAKVDVLLDHRLERVHRQDGRIDRIRMENGAEFRAAVFIDASYEGDLMARAGVSCTVGREGRDRVQVHKIDLPELRRRLREQKQVLSLTGR